MKFLLRPIIDNKTIQDEKISEKKVFVFNVSIIGTNVNQLYFNKVEISLSKGGTSCLGYEMMAVAKKWGISTLIVSCNDVMFANDSGEFQDNGIILSKVPEDGVVQRLNRHDILYSCSSHIEDWSM